MFLSDLMIRRPVLAIVASLLLVVFGIYSMSRMPAREYPNIDPSVVSIQTTYRGAAPEIVETQITQVIEDAISGISGIRTIRSSSSDSQSSISIEFSTGWNIDEAANDVRDRVSRARFLLPQEADTPRIAKREADADPFFWLSVRSNSRNLMELTDYVDRYIIDQMTSLPGVANVFIGGRRKFAMRIWLDRSEMAARGIAVSDIERALQRQNIDIPAGRIESTSRELTVRTDTRLNTPEEFRNVIIARDGDVLVRIGDVARVEIGPRTTRQGLRYNSINAVGVGIVRQSQSNALEVAEEIRAILPRVKAALPEDITMVVSRDDTTFVENSLRQVFFALAIALILVVVVIYLFIGNIRATLIPAVTIPISICASFLVLYAFGYSINVLTLLALALAIGLVVDDSIVVMENISRRIEKDEKPVLAAFLGSRQIYFAVIATTTVLIAVFVPIVLLEGNIGKLFGEFAVALTSAVIFSTFVALSLAPMLCSRLLKKGSNQGKVVKFNKKFLSSWQSFYRRGLEKRLQNPWRTFAAWLALIPLIFALYTFLPKALTPIEDRGEFSIIVQAPAGASWDYLMEHVERAEEIIDGYRDQGVIRGVLTILANNMTGEGAVNNAVIVVKLVDWDEREVSTPDLVAQVRGPLMKLPGARVIPFNRRSFGQRGTTSPVEFVISGYSYETLVEWRDILLDSFRKSDIVMNVRADYDETKPELLIDLDRDRAAALGVDVEDIGRTLETMMGSRTVTRFSMDGEEYDVVLQAENADRMEPSDLTNIFVRSPETQQLVSIGPLVFLKDQAGPSELNRFNRLRSIGFSGQLRDGYTLGQALEEVEDVVQSQLPAEAQLSWDGESRELAESSYAIYFTFALALLVVFLVLSAQFESFVHPLVIIGTVPLGLLGALGLIGALSMPITIYTQIGLVMLIGLIAKNAILMVEFINQLRREGVEFDNAIVEAATTRLRPILMTGFATTVGALPLALTSGAGSEARQAIGLVVLGGVFVGTVLSLYVCPVLYKIICRRTKTGAEVSQELELLLDGKTKTEQA